ncbi:MAG: N-acetyltransferase family protein [Chloroflexota bacterium]
MELITAEQVDRASLQAFLRKNYPPERADFLGEHGAWQHHTDANRLVIQVEGQVAAYCAVIPGNIQAAGRKHSVLWWVDLIVDPAFRGRGLQTVLDQQVRQMSDTLLGFPNALAAKIHRKHGWGVREDLQVFLLPLQPRRVKSIRSATGVRGKLLRLAALALEPAARGLCWRLQSLKVHGARRVYPTSPALLASVWEKHAHQAYNTAWRDEPYVQWRYLSAPYCSQLSFYTAGDPQAPSHYLVARQMQLNGLRFTRILDFFGDLQDTPALHDLLLLASQDAIRQGSAQVTLITSLPGLQPILRRLGFWISTPIGFCWQSRSPELMDILAGPMHWTLADSDNDAPD